MTIDSSMKIS